MRRGYHQRPHRRTNERGTTFHAGRGQEINSLPDDPKRRVGELTADDLNRIRQDAAARRSQDKDEQEEEGVVDLRDLQSQLNSREPNKLRFGTYIPPAKYPLVIRSMDDKMLEDKEISTNMRHPELAKYRIGNEITKMLVHDLVQKELTNVNEEVKEARWLKDHNKPYVGYTTFREALYDILARAGDDKEVLGKLTDQQLIERFKKGYLGSVYGDERIRAAINSQAKQVDEIFKQKNPSLLWEVLAVSRSGPAGAPPASKKVKIRGLEDLNELLGFKGHGDIRMFHLTTRGLAVYLYDDETDYGEWFYLLAATPKGYVWDWIRGVPRRVDASAPPIKARTRPRPRGQQYEYPQYDTYGRPLQGYPSSPYPSRDQVHCR